MPALRRTLHLIFPIAALATALFLPGCGRKSATDEAAEGTRKPRKKLNTATATITYDVKLKTAKLELLAPNGTDYMVRDAAGHTVNDGSVDSSGKVTFTIFEKDLTPGSNTFKIALKNHYGEEHKFEAKVALPEAVVRKPSGLVLTIRGNEKLAEDKSEVGEFAAVFGESDPFEVAFEVVGRLPRMTRTIAVEAKLPDVTDLEVDGKKVPVKDGKATFTLNLMAHLGEVDIKSANIGAIRASVSVPWTFKVKGATHTGFINSSTALAQDLLLSVERGAFLLPGENPNKKGRTRMVWPLSGNSTGPEGTIADIDLVGFQTVVGVVVGKCEYAAKSGAKSSGERIRQDATVAVYERRTGKKLGQKVFEGNTPECKATVTGGESRAASGYVNSAGETWAYTFLDK